MAEGGGEGGMRRGGGGGGLFFFFFFFFTRAGFSALSPAPFLCWSAGKSLLNPHKGYRGVCVRVCVRACVLVKRLD